MVLKQYWINASDCQDENFSLGPDDDSSIEIPCSPNDNRVLVHPHGQLKAWSLEICGSTSSSDCSDHRVNGNPITDGTYQNIRVINLYHPMV